MVKDNELKEAIGAALLYAEKKGDMPIYAAKILAEYAMTPTDDAKLRECPFPDERDTAYMNIKIWLERALTYEANKNDDSGMLISKALHHLPIIKPERATPQKPAVAGEVEAREKKIQTAYKDLLVFFNPDEWSDGDYADAQIYLATLLNAALAAERPVEVTNFSVSTKEGGTWFWFKASDKTECLISAENIIDSFRGGLTRKTLKQWCADRQISLKTIEGEK